MARTEDTTARSNDDAGWRDGDLTTVVGGQILDFQRICQRHGLPQLFKSVQENALDEGLKLRCGIDHYHSGSGAASGETSGKVAFWPVAFVASYAVQSLVERHIVGSDEEGVMSLGECEATQSVLTKRLSEMLGEQQAKLFLGRIKSTTESVIDAYCGPRQQK